MKVSIEIRTDLLKTMIVEDRNEIRTIRASISSVIILLATASFAIAAFLFDHLGSHKVLAIAFTDVFLILLLWLFFLLQKRDLASCRRCLVARQRLMTNLGTERESTEFNPFPDASNEKPDLTDSELYWLPILATVAITVKIIFLWNYGWAMTVVHS